MLKLKCDVPMTRRKRLHHIEDQDGDLLFSSGRVGDCLQWIYDRDERKFIIRVGDDTLFEDFECLIGLATKTKLEDLKDGKG